LSPPEPESYFLRKIFLDKALDLNYYISNYLIGDLAKMNSEDSGLIARICKTLSVDTRVSIVQMLRNQALCVRAIAARLGISESAASQHLRILRDADLVVPDKRGYWVHYQVNPETLNKWGEVIGGFFDGEKRGH